MWEVAFLHRESKTLILVDLIEHITDQTPDIDWKMRAWWKSVFHMWNKPRPAPEYQLGWGDRDAARQSLETILTWDFERIILAHGDLIENDAKSIAREAWRKPLCRAERPTGARRIIGIEDSPVTFNNSNKKEN